MTLLVLERAKLDVTLSTGSAWTSSDDRSTLGCSRYSPGSRRRRCCQSPQLLMQRHLLAPDRRDGCGSNEHAPPPHRPSPTNPQCRDRSRVVHSFVHSFVCCSVHARTHVEAATTTTMAFALLDYISVTQLLILAVGVTLVPLMSDMINLYIPIGRHLNKYLSFVLVGLLYMLSCSALYSFYYIFLPFYHKIGWLADTSESYAIVAVAVWVWFNTNYTYTKTLFTSPSIQHHEPPPPPLDAHTTPSPTTSPISAPSISIDQPASGAADGLTLRKARVPHEPHEHHQQPSEARYCNDCKTFIKAPLTHHCSQCNKCIPNMVRRANEHCDTHSLARSLTE